MIENKRLRELAELYYVQSQTWMQNGYPAMQAIVNNLLDPALQTELKIQVCDGVKGLLACFEFEGFYIGIYACPANPGSYFVMRRSTDHISPGTTFASAPLRVEEVQKVVLMTCKSLLRPREVEGALMSVLEPEQCQS